MIVLVINAGSSSIKYQVYRMPEKRVLAKGLVEKIGEEKSRLVHERDGNKHTQEQAVKDHKAGMNLLLKTLTDAKGVAVKLPAPKADILNLDDFLGESNWIASLRSQ